MSLKNIFRFIIKTGLIAFVFIVFVVSLFYINTTIFNFPEPEAFSGKEIFNPYQNLPDSSYRANFHAHTVAWKSVTNGHNTEKDVFDGYTERGYDIAAISNYHKISTYAKTRTDLYVPAYEHGYNIFKSHCLSINSPKVSYFDYPLYQLKSHKQKIINNIKENGAIVTMAHPKFAGGRTFDDMRHLVGYDFTEVLNHYRISDEYWDQALSAGRLTWIMGDDDTHDILKEPTFRIWNIIYSNERQTDSIMNSMKKGMNYGIASLNQKCDNDLVSCQLDNKDNIHIQFTNIADSILISGQGGKVLKRIYKSDSIDYSFKESDTYVRAVAYNSNSDLYMNPILRFDGKNVPLNSNIEASPSFILTWLFRIIAVLFSLSLVLLSRKIILF